MSCINPPITVGLERGGVGKSFWRLPMQNKNMLHTWNSPFIEMFFQSACWRRRRRRDQNKDKNIAGDNTIHTDIKHIRWLPRKKAVSAIMSFQLQ